MSFRSHMVGSCLCFTCLLTIPLYQLFPRHLVDLNSFLKIWDSSNVFSVLCMWQNSSPCRRRHFDLFNIFLFLSLSESVSMGRHGRNATKKLNKASLMTKSIYSRETHDESMKHYTDYHRQWLDYHNEVEPT